MSTSPSRIGDSFWSSHLPAGASARPPPPSGDAEGRGRRRPSAPRPPGTAARAPPAARVARRPSRSRPRAGPPARSPHREEQPANFAPRPRGNPSPGPASEPSWEPPLISHAPSRDAEKRLGARRPRASVLGPPSSRPCASLCLPIAGAERSSPRLTQSRDPTDEAVLATRIS